MTLRLDMEQAVAYAPNFVGGVHIPATARFMESGEGSGGRSGDVTFSAEDMVQGVGDIVLARRDMGTSYHLSVVLDDAEQGISHVVRGADLFEATMIHVLLQGLLDLPTPVYHHHRLIRDDAGKRLAKRDDARAISLYRAEGATPEDIRAMVGL
jgi:glutamyl-Q tRNA(Asp) synthetase